jgi:hypothetical protein
MVYSQQTATFYGGEHAQQRVEDHTLGFYHALIEARVPFEMVHDRLLDAEHLKTFKLLVLPNIAALSDAQCGQLRQFVERGGSLVATHETSLFDEWGVRRKDFGLADVFRARATGGVQGPMQNSYLQLERGGSTDTIHPLLTGIENTERIINGVYRVEAEALDKNYQPPLTLIPTYPDLPMEEVYPRVTKTNIAEIFLSERGPSRVVYFPWDIDRAFWEVMGVDHGRLLKNAVEWATNEEKPATVTGPGVLDVTVWRQRGSMTVHMVNLTNPMMMKGPFRELISVGGQRVRVRIPKGKSARKVQLLVGGLNPHYEVAGDYLELTVPSINDHEVVAIDF